MAEKEKKRKRHDDKGERPSKKPAVSQVPVRSKVPSKVVVDFVQADATLGPVLASTPGLDFPSRLTLKPYKYTRILPGQTPHNSYEVLLQSSHHQRLDYLAREEKDGSAESQLNDYIGVFDPATGKLEVVQVHKVTVRSSLRSEADEMREEKERIAAQTGTMTARRHALATEFGSRKSKKAIANMTENAIARGGSRSGEAAEGTPKNDSLASAVLDTMNTSAMPTKDDLQALMDSSKPRPRPNLAAEHPTDVYPINTLIGKDLMTMLNVKDWVEAAEAGNGIRVASLYVVKRINKLAKAKEIQKLKALKFILACINFHAALQQKGKGPKRVPPKDKLLPLMGESIPSPVVDAIRRNFAAENNEMTRWHVDNLITHIAAAALNVDNFIVDVDDLRNDLKLDNKEIRQYFQEIGCKVNPPTETERQNLKVTKAEGVNHQIAKLKVPLIFPRVSGPRQRR
ncbi:DNA-directed RNA polymeras-like protein I 49 kDa polypeptide [Clohesyomyces aquaticus]|uniref:DNA-directed RNA polymeras-like protein I 49 kDa polypeptide n=1 Tax=Clohesyomyces aquaticus TaxID=1231657 RepID=A0A1Y2A2F5_9PLEO|nr:DNA-directed RNA polymeras-like protein I 49 kDa polypeptide [Clohesyomyces aquaticus]